MEKVTMTLNEKIDEALEKELKESLKNKEFCNLVKRLKLDKSIVKKNNSKLMDTCDELNNCSNCKGLFMCKNKVNGYVLYPNADGYFPFIKSSYYADNRFGPNSMAIMDTSYECLQILFNSQQEGINKPQFAVSVLGVS